MKALGQLPDLIGRKMVGAEEVSTELVTGSWQRPVFANPNLPHGLVDKAVYSFCVLEQLHRSLRRPDVFARDADPWAKLLAGEKWTAAEPKVPAR
ncbi:hypothetical protein OIE63_23935 [Streptomyces sp. NBC_01795]|uniref:hypothetical protein n=1 Tax=Streptomyces sp. NBC_01795 TaxID=2975943 RepID=UPI002DDAC626|nr:hypothetical protein [Streptomyces sp. NBC_01795]WSA94284.1 hypothetical protein OIE63_23935 [Streptomyces sp. NBC_01795]